MADVVLGGVVGEAEIADDGRRGRLVAVVEVDRRLRGGRRRHRLAAEALARLLEQRPDLVLERLDRGARRLALRHLLLHRQLAPGELLGERVGPRHDAPVVDRAGRARRDAVHAVIADRGIDDVVVVVMRDGVDRAGLLAGVAPDADLRIDQVLLLRGAFIGCFAAANGRCRRMKPRGTAAPQSADLVCPEFATALFGRIRLHHAAIFTYSKSPGLLSMPTFGGAIQPANLPGSGDRLHQRCDEVAVRLRRQPLRPCRFAHVGLVDERRPRARP